ncbi:MAG: four-carbon acid sugar kinase family protein, partial [Microvirga sp.]
AMGLPAAYRQSERSTAPSPSKGFDAPAGRSIILAGSCSSATRGQVKTALEAGVPALRLDAMELASGAMSAATALEWLKSQPMDGPALIYSTATPDEVQAVQSKLGRMNAGEIVESTLAGIAKALPALGFTRLIVAGGETSGAVVNALDVDALAIGPEIDPGVPWTRSLAGIDLALALKSGNFGTPDFFLKAWNLLR